MRLITTEAQRHREIEDGKDPRTGPIIGAAIEVTATWVRDFWSRRTKSACVTNSICEA